jgi:hypothetical protein
VVSGDASRGDERAAHLIRNTLDGAIAYANFAGDLDDAHTGPRFSAMALISQPLSALDVVQRHHLKPSPAGDPICRREAARLGCDRLTHLAFAPCTTFRRMYIIR